MLTGEPIKAAAWALGFELAGICPAQPAEHHDALVQWLERGHHGEMAYMEGHADLRRDPRHLLPDARSILAVGLNYYQPDGPRPGYPRVARYAHGRDYHRVIRGKLRKLVRTLQIDHPEASFRICVDSAPLLEREFAHLAGLGWFGKNTMLIDSRRGSWFLLGFVLTSLEISPDQPALGGCGTCNRCVEACPTGAILFKDNRWQVDARTCISYLTIENPAAADERVGEWTFGCDICQEVCPFNQPRASQPLRSVPTTEPDFLRRNGLLELPLAQLSELDYETWNRATQGSPIRRAGHEGLGRTASLNREEQ